jgi:hypothetical protein
VEVATATRQDFAREIGASTETVTVTESAPLLKTESGEISHTVTADQLNELPILTLQGTGSGLGDIRNPLSLLVATSGRAISDRQYPACEWPAE